MLENKDSKIFFLQFLLECFILAKVRPNQNLRIVILTFSMLWINCVFKVIKMLITKNKSNCNENFQRNDWIFDTWFFSVLHLINVKKSTHQMMKMVKYRTRKIFCYIFSKRIIESVKLQKKIVKSVFNLGHPIPHTMIIYLFN